MDLKFDLILIHFDSWMNVEGWALFSIMMTVFGCEKLQDHGIIVHLFKLALPQQIWETEKKRT